MTTPPPANETTAPPPNDDVATAATKTDLPTLSINDLNQAASADSTTQPLLESAESQPPTLPKISTQVHLSKPQAQQDAKVTLNKTTYSQPETSAALLPKGIPNTNHNSVSSTI